MIPATTTIRLIDIKDDENITDVLNNYELYDPNYRETLNNKIINHYAYDEIGFDTPFLFSRYLKVKLDEIMPKYNLLYKSTLLTLEPLSNFSQKEIVERELETNSETESTSSNTGESNSLSTNNTTDSSMVTEKHVFQQTPQGNLTSQNITNYTYATTHNLDRNDKSSSTDSTITDSTSNESENTSTGTNNTNSTENYIKTIIGNRNITTTGMLTEFINNFKSIDLMIIEELENLFLQKIDLI